MNCKCSVIANHISAFNNEEEVWAKIETCFQFFRPGECLPQSNCAAVAASETSFNSA